MLTSIGPYTIEQLAPGSYDVLLAGSLIAALVRDIDVSDDGWRIDLLDEMPPAKLPPPFTAQSHTFRSCLAALEWLGIFVDTGNMGLRPIERDL